MKYEITKEEGLFRRIEIVETAEVSEKIKNRILREKSKLVEQNVFRKGVNPPDYFKGFRKGHLPPSVIEKYVGGKALCYQSFFNKLYQEFIDGYGFKICSTSKLTDEHILTCEPFSETKVVVELEIFPDVSDFEYKGLEFKKQAAEPTESEIEASWKVIKTKNRDFSEDKKEVVEDKDAVYISFTGDAILSNGDKKTIEKAKNILVIIGEKKYIEEATSFLPFFERNLIGTKKGENAVRFILPEEGTDKELKGAEIKLNVEVNKIGHMEMPEVTDAFIEKISAGKFKTVKEFSNDLEVSIKKRKEMNNSNELSESVFKTLSEAAGDFELPNSMVDRYAVMLSISRIESVAKGKPVDQFIKERGINFKKLKESNLEIAKNVVRRKMIFDIIAEKEGIKITDDFLKKEIETNESYSREEKGKTVKPTVKQLKRALQSSGKYEQFCDDLISSKVEEVIKKNIIFKEEE